MGITQPRVMIKYRDPLFDTVIVHRDINYSETADSSGARRSYLADLYEPADDSSASRPLIVWIHGGGFKYGNKKTGGIPLWCKEFAKRGYVSAAINYRLSKKRPIKKFPDLVEACTNAVEDLQNAIEFFKKNSRQFRIDTTRIIAAGNSAGAITALHAVYSSPGEMMHLINRQGYDTLGKTHNAGGISAVVSFWGALFDSNWLRNATIPIVCAHGTKDKIVPFDHKGPIHGSLVIHRVADSLKIPNHLIVFPGYGHELQKHFNPFFAGRKTKDRWRQAAKGAAEFLYNEFFKK
jgi:dipeptidyl aminopeptidase/acylaminoacyl peptidase